MKRNPEETTLYAMFDDLPKLEDAFRALREDAGISIEDISLLVSEDVRDKNFQFVQKTRTAEGVGAGGALGVALGGVVAGMIGLGALATAVGLFAVGPIIAIGAAGSLIGGLAGHGIDAEQAHQIQAALHQGKTMMAVHTHRPNEIAAARETFRRFGGDELQVET